MNKLKTEIVAAAQGPVESAESNKAVKRFSFTPGFAGFSGHFPGYPVLPAFVQVLASLATIEEWKGKPVQILALEKAKFHIELRPDQEITIQCREYEAKGKTSMEVNVNVAEGLAASFIMKI